MKKQFNKSHITELVSLLRMSELTLKSFLIKELSKYFDKKDIIISKKYVYVKGTLPIMLVSHLDTVGKVPPKNIVYNQRYITSIEEVLGGDDRCGVMAIITLLKKGYRPSVLFTQEEETGGIGATCFIDEQKNIDVKYMIELDRRGKDDAVFYDTGNQDFIEYIQTFGFIENHGSFSDISTLSPQYDIASVNLSIGYYNEHTTREYINIEQMFDTIGKVENMLSDLDNVCNFDMQEICFYNYTPVTTQKKHTTKSSYVYYNGEYVDINTYYDMIWQQRLQRDHDNVSVF